MNEQSIKARIADLEAAVAKGRQQFQDLQTSFQQQSTQLQNQIVLLMGALEEKKLDLHNLEVVEAAPVDVAQGEQKA